MCFLIWAAHVQDPLMSTHTERESMSGEVLSLWDILTPNDQLWVKVVFAKLDFWSLFNLNMYMSCKNVPISVPSL